MKRSQVSLTRVTCSALIGLTAFATCALANKNDGRVTILPPNSRSTAVALSTADWSANWWQWAFQIPNSVNPNLDLTGGSCGVGQWGPVFYLSGGGGIINRTCTVPAGKALFFPIINVECSNIEGPPFQGRNEAELKACVKRWMNGLIPSSLKLTIRSMDGGRPVDISVPNLDSFEVRSPVFTFVLPQDNMFGLPQGTPALSMSDGIWVMLRLAPGRYTVHFEGKIAPPGAPDTNIQNVTYQLTVLGSDAIDDPFE
jgi:hypothetical protein